MDTKYTLICDVVGRVIYGELIEETEHVVKIKNPAIINVVPMQGGKMNVNVFPYFFKEFINPNSNKDLTWVFNRKNITYPENITLDDKLINQHRQLFSSLVLPQAGQVNQNPNSPVIKLFED